ncbi:MAG TPA: hypothetical protein VFN26_03895 [Candidatus Acidoferrum sp.]|nr:hypothetical protein [Candidatus Acidoferrum sp.]
MIDMPEDFNRWPFLRHVMGEYRDVLVETYLDSDRTSLAAQARHKRWVLCAAFLATLAVSLAILQLAGLRVRGIVWLEVMSVVLAALTFWLGYKSRREWLKERHKAEQCRFLKFRSLISPEVHAEGNLPAEVCTRQFSREIETLKTITYEDVGEWLVEDELPSPPGRIVGRSLEDLAQLRGYYREKRLEFQAAYFKRQSERNVKGDQQWRRVPAWLFVGSVICVGLHSVIESTPLNAYALRFVPRLVCDVPLFLLSFIALAALLPVFGSGIRTWRSSREATRNMSRFRAKYVALRNISQRLAGNRIKDDTEAEAILRDIWCSEQIMESEHREWLRLMMEAEWMG